MSPKTNYCMKTCSSCLMEKDEDAFSVNKNKSDGLNYICKDCHNRYVRQHYLDNRAKYIDKAKRRKKEAVKFLVECKIGKTCPYCGEDDPACFDFHHCDPNSKKFEICDGARRGLSIKTLKVEIEKCVMLCSNCHRKHHAGRLPL